MRKTTQKRFEKILQNYYSDVEFSQEEMDELYQLNLEIKSLADNLIISMKAIRDLLFIHELVSEENVDYLKALNIDYSSRIFTNKLIRKYSYDIVIRIFIFAMDSVSNESMKFFENNNPKLWAKKMMFYKSKLKKVCVNNTYDFMTEFLDKLYHTLVILYYDLNVDYPVSLSTITINLKLEDLRLFCAVLKDDEGKTDDSIWLIDYLLNTKDADEIIADYELVIKQEEEKKLSKRKSISIHSGSTT